MIRNLERLTRRRGRYRVFRAAEHGRPSAPLERQRGRLGLTVEFGVNERPDLRGGFGLLDNQRVALGVRIVTDAGDLPRDP